MQNTIFKDKPLPFTGNYFAEISKKIHIIGLPQPVMQVKYLNKILDNILLTDNNLYNTAVVPADETLLVPALHAIDTSNANITMGYPIKRTTIYQLLSDILFALDNKNKLNKKNQQETTMKLYYKDMHVFFNNPYIRDLVNKNSNLYSDIAQKIQKNAKLFYSENEYKQLISNINPQIKELFLELFFTDAVSNICEKIQKLLAEIQKNITLNTIEQECIYLLYNYLEQWNSEISIQILTDIGSFRFLFENYISTLSMSFQSEATENLQIMGLLETRTLDFKHVILLSLNEGTLPAGKTVN
jgi:hypothetical protein